MRSVESVPEYMNGIVRCGRVEVEYDDRTEEDFEKYVDNAEYASVRERLSRFCTKSLIC